jgi:hypothetical protein
MAKAQTETPEAEKATAPILYVVRESFVVDVGGVPTAYRKGEVVHPDDPVRKNRASLFSPFEFPHPVRSRVTLATPEIRAD